MPHYGGHGPKPKRKYPKDIQFRKRDDGVYILEAWTLEEGEWTFHHSPLETRGKWVVTVWEQMEALGEYQSQTELPLLNKSLSRSAKEAL